MKFIVTRGKTPLSSLICWGLKEPVSHFALVFDNKLVLGSNLIGVHLSWLPTVIKNSKTYYEIDCPMTLEQEEEVYQSVITSFDGKPYDYSQFLKFIWAGFKFRFFGVEIESKKIAKLNNAYLCTEIIQVLPDFIVSQETKEKTLGLVSPWMLFNILIGEIKNDLK